MLSSVGYGRAISDSCSTPEVCPEEAFLGERFRGAIAIDLHLSLVLEDAKVSQSFYIPHEIQKTYAGWRVCPAA